MPNIPQVVCQVLYMHYLICSSLELYGLGAKEFELHFVYLEGMGSIEGFEEEELLAQIGTEPAHGMLHTRKGDISENRLMVAKEMGVGE